MQNPFAQLKSLPKNQRVALGVGGLGAAGAGLYSYRKKKLAGTTSPAKAPAANAVGSALQPAPDLSQYGQVAVLVPIDWQDGANFGGTAGLTGPLNPSNPTNTPAPAPAPVPAPTADPAADHVYGPIPANPVAGYQPDGSILSYSGDSGGGWTRIVPLGPSGYGTAYGPDPNAVPTGWGGWGPGINANMAAGLGR